MDEDPCLRCNHHELDSDVREALAQALGEHKTRVTDRRMLILYVLNISVLILVVVALFSGLRR